MHARDLITSIKPHKNITCVGLVVDADDDEIATLVRDVPLDMLQLHGSESPQRSRAIKKRFGLPVMKAINVSIKTDLMVIDQYHNIVDMVLVDAKPTLTKKNRISNSTKSALHPLLGGNGIAFDWRILEHNQPSIPWMLAGGLTVDNVTTAIRITKAAYVDVSSGVEIKPGLKSADKINAFIQAAKNARF